MSQSNLSAASQEAANETILDIDLKLQAQKGPDLRKNHAKSHGLLWGEFRVEDTISDSLKVGVLLSLRPIRYG